MKRKDIVENIYQLKNTAFLPAQFQTKEQIAAAVQTAKELGLPALRAISGMYIINGKIGLETTLIMALARKHGIVWKVIEESKDKCVVEIKDAHISYISTYTLEDAKRNFLLGKTNWVRNPQLMMLYRAIAKGLRIVAPHIFYGVYTTDEIEDMQQQIAETKEITEEEIKELYEDTQKESEEKIKEEEIGEEKIKEEEIVGKEKIEENKKEIKEEKNQKKLFKTNENSNRNSSK
jgi:uncharacterized protein YneF (UPF0154 family)